MRPFPLVITLALLASSPALAPIPSVPPDVPTGADAARDAVLANEAAAIVDVPVSFDALLVPGGQRVTFISTRDGLPQLYVADFAHPDAAPRRLVTSPERVGGTRVLPDGKAVLFRMDRGSDENWRIYRVAIAGGEPTELTPGEVLQRDTPFVPDGTPTTMVYSGRVQRERTSHVYVQGLARGAPPRRVYSDPSPGGLSDVSRDGKRALFARRLSVSQNILLVVDLATGKAEPLYPAAGKDVRIQEAAFSSDGARVLVATDEGGEQEVLLALDAKSGKELRRYRSEPATAAVRGLEVSGRGDRIAVLIDAGNRDEVRLLDAKELTPVATVRLPLGSGGLGEFTDDGSRLTLTWSTASAPAAPMVVDAKTGKAEPLRAGAPAALANLPPVETSIVEVPSFDGLKIPVNLYLPGGGTGSAEKMPVIVSVHGGPAGASAIRWNPLHRYFLARGFAIVEPNVRGSSGFGRAFEMGDDGRKRLDGIHDLERVGRWAAAQPWADKDRLVLFGGSYGGYSVLMGLTRQSDLWRAGVDLFGVSDVRHLLQTTTGFIQEVFKREFGEVSKDGAFLDSISPIHDAAKIEAPLFVYAGENDPRVPRPESDAIVAEMRQREVPVEYMVAPNEGHSMDRRENKIAFLSRVTRFLEAHLARERTTR